MTYKRFLGAASAALMIVIATLMLTPCAGAASKYKTLHAFRGRRARGGYPKAGLVFDSNGNLYGMTSLGGRKDTGVVFKLTPNPDGSWKEKVLYSFCALTNCSDGASPIFGDLVFDAAGNLYGTTSEGGIVGCGSDNSVGCGVVFQLTPNADGSWTESVLHSFCAHCGDGNGPEGGLIFDPAGNLYGTARFGGTSEGCGGSGCGTVFRLAPNSDGSWTESVLYNFPGSNYSPGPYLIFDQGGNLYGATSANGNGGTVFRLTPNADGSWTESALHHFSGGSDGQNPWAGLIFDPAGNLYGTTTEGGNLNYCNGGGCGVVFKLTHNPDGSWREKVLYSFTGGRDGSVPVSLIFDRAGNLYGTTVEGGNLSLCNKFGCGVVFKLTPNSKGGWRETVLHSFQDQPGARPYAPLTFDATGNLYGTADGSFYGSVFEITP
jgi:uncharacterized repeat protein (TIGR03803 family)